MGTEAAVSSTTAPARATLEHIKTKILSGRPLERQDWEKFQVDMLDHNLKLCEEKTSTPRVRADAAGKCIWAAQMNLEMCHSDEKMREEFAQRDRLEENRMDRRMDLEQVMKGHRWRTKNKKEWGDTLEPPEHRTFAIPPYKAPALKWPIEDGAPPAMGEEFDTDAVPEWVNDYLLGRPVEADDLPDEAYWFGRRPQRFGERKKEPLYRVVKFRNGDQEMSYRKTERGKAEYPELGKRKPIGFGTVLLDDDEISEHEAKAFGEQKNSSRR